MFSGCITALVTPFKNGKVDYKKLIELIDFQIANKVSGIVLCGTTGESPTLSDSEKEKIFRTGLKHCRGRVKLIAGTGTNDTAKTIELTKMAKSVGMDGALIVTPYYNKPTQEGLYRHYWLVADAVRIPIILYNVPGRTGVSLAPETVARLSVIKNIVAIKEASGDIDLVSRIRRLCPITILSGEDALTFPILCLGGKGVITTVSNLIPADIVSMIDCFNAGRIDEAREWHLKMLPLVKAVFIESNPIPTKTAMLMLGRLNGEMRMPLCCMGEANAAKLKQELKNYRLLK